MWPWPSGKQYERDQNYATLKKPTIKWAIETNDIGPYQLSCICPCSWWGSQMSAQPMLPNLLCSQNWDFWQGSDEQVVHSQWTLQMNFDGRFHCTGPSWPPKPDCWHYLKCIRHGFPQKSFSELESCSDRVISCPTSFPSPERNSMKNWIVAVFWGLNPGLPNFVNPIVLRHNGYQIRLLLKRHNYSF